MTSHFFRARLSVGLAALFFVSSSLYGVIPSPEKLLPDDTLVLLTATDFAKLRAVWEKLPQRQLWNDPAMKPFREDFTTKWNEQIVKPLERELDIKFEDYTSLMQGQVTFALIQNAGQADSPQAGMVLLLDTKERSAQIGRASCR